MRRTLILFDIDGTLVDTAGAGRRAMDRACAAVLGIDGVSARTSGVAYAGRTDPRIMRSVCEAVGVGADLFAERGEELTRRFVEELQSEMRRDEPRRRVLPGVRALLDDLERRDDVQLALVTGNLEVGARAKLEPFDLNRYFATGGFSSDAEDRREIARIARERATRESGVDFPASSVTVIGDTELDIDCARANGFRAVAVSSGWVPRERLVQARPDVLLDDLDDLPTVLAALRL